MEHDELVAALRFWAGTQSRDRRAAVELLIGHGFWLRRADFRRHAVGTSPDGGAWIRFTNAREAFAKEEVGPSSTTERAMLDLILALGEDRFALTYMGARNAQLIIDAVTTATGLGRQP